MLAETFVRAEGAFALIGVGGIHSPHSALAKIEAGASLVQLYSAMVYRGPALVPDIKAGLLATLRREKLPGSRRSSAARLPRCAPSSLQARTCDLIASDQMLQVSSFTHFLHANRYPLRSKMLLVPRECVPRQPRIKQRLADAARAEEDEERRP